MDQIQGAGCVILVSFDKAFGRPLTFAKFMSFVIDEERLWIKDLDFKRGVSQVLTTFDHVNDDSSTRQGADTDTDTNSCNDNVSCSDSCNNDDPCNDNESCSDDNGSVE